MTSPAVPRRSRAIEGYRFLFAVVISLFHFRVKGDFAAPTAFSGGYLGVEFFALTSGYFLMGSIRRGLDQGREGAPIPALVGRFALGRYLRLYPHYLLTLVLFFSMRIFYLHTLTVKDCLRDGFFDLFMLQAFGFPYLFLLVWYVSALFIASVLLYWLALVLREHFVIAMAFAAPLVLSCFYQYYGTVDNPMHFAAAGSRGLWRLAAGLGLGCIIYELVQQGKPRVQGRFALASTLLELGLLAGVLFICWQGCQDQKDFIAIVLLFFLVLSIFLGNSCLTRLLDNPVSGFLGKLSYGFYLNQSFFLHLFGQVIPVRDYWRGAALYLALDFLLSLLTYLPAQWLGRLMERLVKGWKGN